MWGLATSLNDVCELGNGTGGNWSDIFAWQVQSVQAVPSTLDLVWGERKVSSFEVYFGGRLHGSSPPIQNQNYSEAEFLAVPREFVKTADIWASILILQLSGSLMAIFKPSSLELPYKEAKWSKLKCINQMNAGISSKSCRYDVCVLGKEGLTFSHRIIDETIIW